MKLRRISIFIILLFFAGSTYAFSGHLTLECKEKEDHNAHTITINYDLGMALYISPNKYLTDIYPSTSINSFQADKDVSTIGIAGRFIILEKTSYDEKVISSGNKIEKVSWYEKRVIELLSQEKAVITRLWGSKLNDLGVSEVNCDIKQTQATL